MKSSVSFIFHFIFKEKKLFALGVFCTFSGSLLTWLGPKIIALIIDQGVVPQNKQIMFWGAIALALSEAFRLGGSLGGQWVYAALGQNVIERVRGKMVGHLLKLPVSYFDQVTSGGMMTRVVNDVNSLNDFFQSGFVSILGNGVSIIAIFGGLFLISAKLGFVLFLSFLPILAVCVYFSEKLRAVYEITRNALSALNSRLADTLFGMRTVRALGVGDQKFNELSVQVRTYADAQTKTVSTFAMFHPVLTLGTGIMLFILIGMGIPLVSSGELRVGQWVAALSYVVLLQQPLVEISDRWNYFLGGLTSIGRIQEILALKVAPTGKAPASRLQEIRFDHLSFEYEGATHRALSEVNLVIKRGDWTGIFGESGSGKSTLLQMLYGFYEPSSGQLFWNGQAYSTLNRASLRTHFGVVEQFPFLLAGSIRENISLFGEHFVDEISLAETFSGYPLIESLLRDLEFEITERGQNLSMGQRQMITFLRAYLAKPDVWILDEATAFFDEAAEQEVLRALHALKKEQITVIQVAHRREALLQMDQIIQVEKGQVRLLGALPLEPSKGLN